MPATTYNGQPFIIDGILLNMPASGSSTGQVINDATPVSNYKISESFEVVVQEVDGFKWITQATEPYGLKEVSVEFLTQTEDIWGELMRLDNTHPHTIMCNGLPEALLAYMTKRDFEHKEGEPDFTFHWDMEFKEANDNN